MNRRKITSIILHCTASAATATLTPEALDTYHRSLGWAGCGYHYYITRDGQIHPMRDTEKAGAHAKGFNASSIGIAYEGGLDVRNRPADTRTEAQRRSLETLLRYLLLVYPRTQILGHRDLSPDLNGDGKIEPAEWIKACPCFNASTEYAPLIKEQQYITR